MRILSVHGRYAQRGGEDAVYEAERDLLRENGYQVEEYVQNNDSIQGALGTIIAGPRTVWSQQDYRRIRACIRERKVELVAVHNFFPLISPSVYYAAHAEGVPVVQTLHNYRLICPAATLFRDGELCEDCVGKKIALPGIVHGCYRSSPLLTAGVAAMISIHHALGTWDRYVTRYIALTEFMRGRLIAGGFNPEKIAVKPNFTPDFGVGSGEAKTFVFAGRLSPEKGVSTLLRAWALSSQTGELRILGTGPEELALKAQAASLSGVTFLGRQPSSRVRQEMGQATAVILPSLWHEGLSLTVIEALAQGTPVLASHIGSMESLITPGRSGMFFARGDAAQLAKLLDSRPLLEQMRAGARAEYEVRFTPQQNYTELDAIYRSLIAERSAEAIRRNA